MNLLPTGQRWMEAQAYDRQFEDDQPNALRIFWLLEAAYEREATAHPLHPRLILEDV